MLTPNVWYSHVHCIGRYVFLIYLTYPNAVLVHFLFCFFRASFNALTVVRFVRLPLVNRLSVVRVAHVAAFAGSDATPIVVLKKNIATCKYVTQWGS